MNEDIAIQLEGVSKHFQYFDLKNVDLCLPKGQIMGFVGANGAGKTTTIRLIMGLMQADKGKVKTLGHSMPTAQAEMKKHVGFSSEEMKLYGNKNLAWHMGFIQSVFPTWNQTYASELLSRFDLNLEQKLKEFSKGQHVKAQLLLTLARQPKLLVLDEPTTGLDPVARQEVMEELALVLKDEDRSVLFSSHNTSDVEKISDQITFIDRGAIVDSDDKESFLENWRSIQIELSDDNQVSIPQGFIDIEQQGRIARLTTKAFNQGLLEVCKANKFKVLSVEKMSLEEIFLANVKYCRKGEKV